jgi:hypothetical protein
MEADVVRGFETLVQGYETLQLLDGLQAIRQVAQGNVTGPSAPQSWL